METAPSGSGETGISGHPVPEDSNGHPGNGFVASGSGGRAQWVGIVANRGSGMGGSQSLVRRLCIELAARGYRTEVAWTPEERHQLVAHAGDSRNCRCLVAVGGDGTVAALVNEQPKVPITVLPSGTENLAAQHFGLRRNPGWLARTIDAGEVVRTDVGCADGRRFILMTGFGFDGDVVTRHHRSRVTSAGRVKPTHRAAYVEPILRASLFYRFPAIKVSITDPGVEEVLNGTTVFVFNLPRYALGLPFAPQASGGDGLLDLVVFRDPGPFQALYYLWRVFRGTHLEHPGVFHRRVRGLVVSSGEMIPVQLDGDPAGFLGAQERPDKELRSQTPVEPGWTIKAIPAAIDVLVPSVPARTPQEQAVPLAKAHLPG